MPLTRFDTQAIMGADACLSSSATHPISHGKRHSFLVLVVSQNSAHQVFPSATSIEMKVSHELPSGDAR